MKFTVNRLLMYQAVKTVLKVVRPRREIPEIGGLLVEADGSEGILTITGTMSAPISSVGFGWSTSRKAAV